LSANFADILSSLILLKGGVFLVNGIDWEDVDEAKKKLSKVVKKMEERMGFEELNLNELHEELRGYYNTKIQENANTQEINEALTKLQNTRSRVAYIVMQADRQYKSKKAIIDILTPILAKDADPKLYKNKESRDGFAMERLADYVLDLHVADFLKEDANNCLSNLNDTISIISRQITVLQLEIQLGQISRPEEDMFSNSKKFPYYEDATWKAQDEAIEDDEGLSVEDEQVPENESSIVNLDF